MFDFWTGAQDLSIWGFLIRALIVYVYVFLMIKVLGQRSIGTIHPLDFLFGVIIGDVIGEPLSNGDASMTGPTAAAALIAGLHYGLAYISLKTPRFRRIVEDEPLILIEKGRILPEQLKKTKMTMESLFMDLRLNNAIDINEVDYAILESNGQISVIKKGDYEPVTPYDLQIQKPDKGYPSVLIQDGQIIHANLKRVGTLSWLNEQIRRKGFQDPSEIFLLTMDESGQMYISKK